MADPRPRRQRLLGLLPKLIAEQPPGSPVAALVDVMAGVLAELDEAQDRTLRDHWSGLARGETPADEALAILERLSPYLGLAKQDGETREDHRLRLMRADRLDIDGTTPSLKASWQKAMEALVRQATERLQKDLEKLEPDDAEGIRRAWCDQWTRLAGSDPVLKQSGQALAVPAASRDTLPKAAEPLWTKALTDYWRPKLDRHWAELALSNDAQAPAQDALSRLAKLLGIARLQREIFRKKGKEKVKVGEIREDIEAFRRRIQATAKIMGYGLTSPKALLDLAMVTLGAEPCSQQKTDRDAVLAHGVPPGVARNCPVCRGEAQGDCPNAGQWVVEAWITDNPLRRREWTAAAWADGEGQSLDNQSLETAMPELRIRAMDKAICYPSLENRDTGEIMLYAGEIGPGGVLSLWPRIIEQKESEAFANHDGIAVYAWRGQYPQGRAMLAHNEKEIGSDVSDKIYYLSGVKFPAADVQDGDREAPRFAKPDADDGACFGTSGQEVRVPRLKPGCNQWFFRNNNNIDVKTLLDHDAAAWLGQAPASVEQAPAAITLSWWERPPAQFRLSVLKNSWTARADEYGALDHLARLLQRAKAAGVTALLDFPEQPQREEHAAAERLRLQAGLRGREDQGLQATALVWQAAAVHREAQPLGEGVLMWTGVFDHTRFDGSRLE